MLEKMIKVLINKQKVKVLILNIKNKQTEEIIQELLKEKVQHKNNYNLSKMKI